MKRRYYISYLRRNSQYFVPLGRKLWLEAERAEDAARGALDYIDHEDAVALLVMWSTGEGMEDALAAVFPVIEERIVSLGTARFGREVVA